MAHPWALIWTSIKDTTDDQFLYAHTPVNSVAKKHWQHAVDIKTTDNSKTRTKQKHGNEITKHVIFTGLKFWNPEFVVLPGQPW